MSAGAYVRIYGHPGLAKCTSNSSGAGYISRTSVGMEIIVDPPIGLPCDGNIANNGDVTLSALLTTYLNVAECSWSMIPFGSQDGLLNAIGS